MGRWLIPALAIIPGAADAKPCAVSESRLMGAWKGASAGFFEEMAFDREGEARVFNSWLHHRPELRGANWSLSGCALSIADPRDRLMRFDFAVVRVTRDTLVLRDREDNALSTYRRIR